MGLFSKKMTYKDLTIEAGAGGIDITRAGVKKHYTFDEFAAIVYPLFAPAINTLLTDEERQGWGTRPIKL